MGASSSVPKSPFGSEPLVPASEKKKGARLTYVEVGDPEGTPVVFMHGNPTSSYMWRNVMRSVEENCKGYRLIAPDLLGMGDSEKNDEYTYEIHYSALEQWFDAVIPDGKVILVVHDWGSGLGFNWASNHSERVLGIAYGDALIGILTVADHPFSLRMAMKGMRGFLGGFLVQRNNIFIEKVLPDLCDRPLDDQEMAEYRRPFPDYESRKVMLDFPRMVPYYDLEDRDNVGRIVEKYRDWLKEWKGPKLWFRLTPGTAIAKGDANYEFASRLSNQTIVDLIGQHYFAESDPVNAGVGLANWLKKIEA